MPSSSSCGGSRRFLCACRRQPTRAGPRWRPRTCSTCRTCSRGRGRGGRRLARAPATRGAHPRGPRRRASARALATRAVARAAALGARALAKLAPDDEVAMRASGLRLPCRRRAPQPPPTLASCVAPSADRRLCSRPHSRTLRSDHADGPLHALVLCPQGALGSPRRRARSAYAEAHCMPPATRARQPRARAAARSRASAAPSARRARASRSRLQRRVARSQTPLAVAATTSGRPTRRRARGHARARARHRALAAHQALRPRASTPRGAPLRASWRVHLVDGASVSAARRLFRRPRARWLRSLDRRRAARACTRSTARARRVRARARALRVARARARAFRARALREPPFGRRAPRRARARRRRRFSAPARRGIQAALADFGLGATDVVFGRSRRARPQ